MDNMFTVFSVQELEKVQDLLEDYNYFSRILLVEPNNKKASKMLDKSFTLLLTIINPKTRILYKSVPDAMKGGRNNVL